MGSEMCIRDRRYSSRLERGSTTSRRYEGENGNIPMDGSFTDHLPQNMSKAAMTYRTNEWAKHIADADVPELGALPGSTTSDAQADAFAEETARLVDTEDLQQGMPGARRMDASRNPYRQLHSQYNQPRITTQGLRNVSAPMTTQGMVESPIEASPTHSRNSSSPYNMPSSNNLLDQRTQRLRQKPASTSFHTVSYTHLTLPTKRIV